MSDLSPARHTQGRKVMGGGEGLTMANNALHRLRINGEDVEVLAPQHWTLLEVLRYKLGLTGTKQGCDKGDCVPAPCCSTASRPCPAARCR